MQDYTITTLSPKDLFDKGKEVINDSFQEGVTILSEANKMATQQKDYNLVCEILVFLSRKMRFQEKYFESMEYLNKAYRTLNRYIPHNKKQIGWIYKEYGSLYTDGFQDYTSGLNYSLKSLKFNIEEIKPSLLTNIGCQYIHLNEFDKAFSFLNQGKEICEVSNELSILCFIYENLGNLFFKKEDYLQAEHYYQLGLETCKQSYLEPKNQQITNYIYCYIQFGLAETYLASNKIELIEPIILAVRQKAESFNLKGHLSKVLLIEGKLILRKKEVKKFEKLFHKAIPFCIENEFYEDREQWLKLAIDVCEKENRHKEAIKLFKQVLSNKEAQEVKTRNFTIDKVLENKEIEILELENRNRENQLQKEQLEQFAYILAHDLRTPLSNISNFVNLFSKKIISQLDKQNQVYLEIVKKNSDQLRNMLEDLLKYITFKNEESDLPICDVEKIVIQIIEKNAESISETNATIIFESLGIAKIHPFHLESILDNLVKNAIKFSKKNIAPIIEIKTEETEQEYLFKIKDNGIGIQEDFHKKIFQVFNRLENQNMQSTGIGLSMCKKIINTYGGKIWIEGNENGGSTFIFSIPKKKSVEIK